MDSSETDLDRMEAQRSTDMSHEEQKETYLTGEAPLLRMNILRSQDFSQSGGDGATLPTGDTETLPEFLINLRLSEIFALPGNDVQMTPEDFSKISYGSKECLEELRSNGMPISRLKSNEGDSVLHLAAAWGHLELVEKIVPEFPFLLLVPNSSGKTPLHLAAKRGHTAVVEAFVELVTFASARLCNEGNKKLNPYVIKDEDGNTALHLAIEGHYLEIATCLVNTNQDAPFLENNKGVSSLCVAAQVGYESLVKAILETIGNEHLQVKNSNLYSKLQGKKCLAHVALNNERLDVLDYLLDEYPSLMDEQDSKGRNCLSYGVFKGYYKGVCKLLDRSTKGVYVCDREGSFPIHMAAKEGHHLILEKIIERCPDSKHLLNKLGQNVLHVAAISEHHWAINLWMSNKDMKPLAVEQDVDGNTPLHLAVINWNYDFIPWLARSSKILRLRNKSGLSAWKIAESNMKPNYIFKERWTLALILYISHSKQCIFVDSLTRSSQPLDPKNNRDYVNSLLVVAALVATVTFAAGFTIPGGFNSDDKKPNLGRATLATNPTLWIFLLLNILAMQSSVATIGILIWAQLGDPVLIRSSLHVALPLLLFALLCMPLAFLFAVVTAIGHVKWLLIIISIISGLFFFVAIFVFGPHVMLQRSRVSPKYTGKFLVTFMRFKEHFEFLADMVKALFCWTF